MLQSFRGMTKGVGAWIIVGLFILAFAVVGVPSLNNFGGNAPLKVGEQSYSIRDVEREFSRLMDLERRRTGAVLTRDAAVSSGLLSTATNTLLLQGLYQEEATKLGVTVTDKMIQDFLNRQENLLNPQTGKFDSTMLSRVLQSNNLSISEFKRQVAQDLIRTQIDSAVAIGTPAPSSMARLIALRQTEERVVRTATLPLPTETEATDAELRSFYAANAVRYETPERREYTLVVLDRDSIAGRVAVDPAEVESLFNSRSARLGTPETRSFNQAQFPNADIAAAVADAMIAGQSLEDAAAERGFAVTTFTDEIRTNLIDANVAQAVFAASEPGLVGPVQGDFGVVVAEIQSITPGVTVALEDVREGLEAELYDEVFRNLIEELYNDLQESGDAGDDLASAAAAIDLTVRSVGPVDRQFFTPEGLIEDNIPLAVHNAAFAMAPNAIFEDIDLPEGGSAFVEVLSVTPATPQPYESVAADVARDWQADKKAEITAELGARFEALVAQGQSFNDAAAELGGEVVSRTLAYFEPSPDVPPSLTRALFTLPIGEVTSATAVDGDGAFVAQIESVRFAPNARLDDTSTSFQGQLTQSISSDLYDAYIEAAQDEFVVTRNTAQLAQSFGSDQ